MQLDEVRKDLNEEYRIVERTTFDRLRASLAGQVVASGKGVKKGDKLTKEQLEAMDNEQLFKLRMVDDALNEQMDSSEEQLVERRRIMDVRFEDKHIKVSNG